MPSVPAQPFLPFAQPEIGEEEIAEVVQVLRSGWITTGARAKRFEEDFAAFVEAGASSGMKPTRERALQAVAVNSATAGLHLALEALGLGPGDEVITSTHTFTATAEVVRYLGADVKLVDVDPATLNLDLDQVASAIGPRTKVLLPVHYGGLAAPMAPLWALARQHGLRVVEDAAHALPSSCGGALVGSHDRASAQGGSDAVVFSFYANKTITTGEGGMLVTRDAALAQRARVMRLHGMNRDAFDRFTSKVPAWYYEVVAPGFKYNLTDIAAALGIHQLKKAKAFAERRAEIAAQYTAAFASLPVLLPAGPAAGEQHAWHLYALRLGDAAVAAGVTRDGLVQHLFDQGIGVSVHYIPLHQHPYWRERYGLQASQFPHSQMAYERLVSLPIYTRMGQADVKRVIAAVHSALAPATRA